MVSFLFEDKVSHSEFKHGYHRHSSEGVFSIKPCKAPHGCLAHFTLTHILQQDFAELDPYSPVKPLPVLAAELGIDVKDLAKLDANENLYGPVQQVRQDKLSQNS